jgi:hypothetical protein
MGDSQRNVPQTMEELQKLSREIQDASRVRRTAMEALVDTMLKAYDTEEERRKAEEEATDALSKAVTDHMKLEMLHLLGTRRICVVLVM